MNRACRRQIARTNPIVSHNFVMVFLPARQGCRRIARAAARHDSPAIAAMHSRNALNHGFASVSAMGRARGMTVAR